MASEKQIAANRANAKKGTGPGSTAGKAISSQKMRPSAVLQFPITLSDTTTQD